MRLWLEHGEKPLSGREEHAQILDALRTRDADLAERVLREHIEGTLPALTLFLQSEQ